jgi:hypothetical protein
LRDARAFELHEDRAFAHLVANLDDDRFHDAIAWRGNFHGRLVGLQRDQRIFRLHLVARLDEYLDNRNFLEVTDIGNLDVDQTTHCSTLGSDTSQGPWRGTPGVDLIFGDGLRHDGRLDRAVVCKGLERRDGDIVPVDLEEFP